MDDRRTKKTKKALRESLANLMLLKDLNNITIKELTDNADVHRSTFYSHYTDIFELYYEIENDILSNLSFILNNENMYTTKAFFITIIDYIYDNQKLFSMFISDNYNGDFITKASKLVEDNYLNYYLVSNDNDLVYYINYHVQGCIGILIQWSSNNYSITKEKILNIIIDLHESFEKLYNIKKANQ